MASPTLDGELMFPSNYLTEQDLKGQEWKMTIAKVKKDELPMEGGKKKMAFLLEFQKAKKALVLNKTNAKIIMSMLGTEAEKWVGKEITLIPTTCKFKGNPNYPCIRIKEEFNAE